MINVTDLRPLLNTHAGFVAEGGYYREEAIMLLRRFYMSENSNGASHASTSSFLHVLQAYKHLIEDRLDV